MGRYFTHGSPQKKSCAASKCNIYTQNVEYSDRLPVKGTFPIAKSFRLCGSMQ
jgi:hypothetical protein